MLESRIYVGLLDKDTREQMYEIEDYKLRLRGICKTYKAPFSVTFMEGGYFHDDGSWVEENSLMVTLLNVPEIPSMPSPAASARNSTRNPSSS